MVANATGRSILMMLRLVGLITTSECCIARMIYCEVVPVPTTPNGNGVLPGCDNKTLLQLIGYVVLQLWPLYSYVNGVSPVPATSMHTLGHFGLCSCGAAAHSSAKLSWITMDDTVEIGACRPLVPSGWLDCFCL